MSTEEHAGGFGDGSGRGYLVRLAAATGEWIARECRPSELAADLAVHAVGGAAGVAGVAALLLAAAATGSGTVIAACGVYAAGLLLMLGCSAACNLAFHTRHRELLRSLDHAAIFVMIAGTYTPFTACRLHGGWAIGLSVAEWGGALLGAAAKLVWPRKFERVSLFAYLALGWLIVVGARPVLATLDAGTLSLLALGGALYMSGLIFHLWRGLPFQSALWHLFVLLAAAAHYVAVLDGVVLPSLR